MKNNNFINFLPKIFSILFLSSIFVIIFWQLERFRSDLFHLEKRLSEKRHGAPIATFLDYLSVYPIVIAFIVMIISGIGTISTLIFAWRKEIRDKSETELRIEKLELEIAELKSKKKRKKP